MVGAMRGAAGACGKGKVWLFGWQCASIAPAGQTKLPNNRVFHQQASTVSEPSNPLILRVYWEDTDAGGVVFYANYLKYFERARTEWLRGLGLQQSILQAEMDCIFVVAEVHLRYLAPARLDDMITVTVRMLEQGRASLQLEQQAWRGKTLLAEGRVRVGCVSASSLKPRRIPDGILAMLGANPTL
jgi:acyl-CoA thioester hydrolase